jgi:hypothetical protein
MTAGTSAIEARRPVRIGWLWPSLFGLAALSLVIQLMGSLNHDTAFTMIGAERLLDGGRYGVDVVDPNLPLAYWIAILPAAFARLTGLGLGISAILFTATIALLGISLVSAVLSRTSLAEAPRNALLLFVAAILLLAPGIDFGQREHLMLAGGLPWILAAGAAAERVSIPRRLRILVGVAAGLAFCLKPHFLLVPILVEAWLLLRYRRLSNAARVENLAVAATGVAFASAILLAAPDYLRSVVPDAAAVYWAFESRLSFLLKLPSLLLPFALASVLAREEMRFPHPMVSALLAASAGALLAAVLQFKGWDYHWLPMIGFAAIAGAAAYCASFAWSTLSARTAVAAALLFAGAFWGLAADARDMYRSGGDAEQVARLTSALKRHAAPGSAVFAFITSPRAVHPAVVASGMRWSAAACCLQWVPAEVRAAERADAGRVAEVTQRKREDLLSELERIRPEIILVDDRPFKLGFGGRSFDYLDHFIAHPRFRILWADYREQERVAGYRLFLRIRD